MEAPEQIYGWKDIARYLQISVRSAQTFEKERGLPIQHQLGAKGRVYALRQDLDVWVAEFRKHKLTDANYNLTDPTMVNDSNSRATVVPEAVPVEYNEGQALDPELSTVSALAETVQSNNRLHFSLPKKLRRRFLSYIFAGLLTSVIAVATFVAKTLPSTNPVRLKVEGPVLIALDDQHRKVWSYTFSDMPVPQNKGGFYDPVELFADLDHDGKNELLFNYRPVDPAKNNERGVYCFSSTGRLRWTFHAGHPIRTRLGRQFSGEFHSTTMGALSKPRSDGGRILIGSHHSFSWPFQVALLTVEGKQVAEYWHPGWLWPMKVVDLNGDGVEEILLGGVNNSYSEVVEDGLDYGATLVVLDSRRIYGQGSTTGKDDRVVAGVPPADETAVLQFRALIETGDSDVFYIVRAIWPGRDAQLLLDVGCPNDKYRHPRTLFQLDARLQPLNIQPELNFHNQLIADLPKTATVGERLAHVRNRIGKVMYLKNKWAE